jgi:hypothetical protein
MSRVRLCFRVQIQLYYYIARWSMMCVTPLGYAISVHTH